MITNCLWCLAMQLYLHDIRLVNYSSRGEFPDKSAVQIFAADASGAPVFVRVDNFRPWFYLELPGACDVAGFEARCKSQLWYSNVLRFEEVSRQRFVGFADGKRFRYVYVEFSGVVPMYCGRKKLREMDNNIKIHEDRVDSVLKFFHSTRLRPCSYFQMSGEVEVLSSMKTTHCSREYIVDVGGLSPVSAELPPPPMVICGYDIESSGLDPKTDFVFQVSMSGAYSSSTAKFTSSSRASSASMEPLLKSRLT